METYPSILLNDQISFLLFREEEIAKVFEEEIEKSLKEGKGWSQEERQTYIEDIGEHPLFSEDVEV